MNLLNLKISPHKIYWFLIAGKPVRRLTSFDLYAQNFSMIEQPVFFLSTGRTRTMWFAHLFAKAKNYISLHEPFPEVAFAAKKFYQLMHTDPKYADFFALESFKLARAEYLLYSYRANKRYLETNNELTLFAYAIHKLLPSAKFVHIYRHPGEFIMSGLARNWYVQGNNKITKLITPNNLPQWDSYSQKQKIAWLWTEVNSFIEKFKSTLPANQIFEIDFNRIDIQTVKKLRDFLEADLPDRKIAKFMDKKLNVTHKQIEHYSRWPDEEKQAIRQICAPLCEKYGYEL